jgi:hypothetical protein
MKFFGPRKLTVKVIGKPCDRKSHHGLVQPIKLLIQEVKVLSV